MFVPKAKADCLMCLCIIIDDFCIDRETLCGCTVRCGYNDFDLKHVGVYHVKLESINKKRQVAVQHTIASDIIFT